MNAANAVRAAWWAWKPARAVRLKRPEAGYARYEAERRAGLPGRVFLSFMGLVVALLSATGIVIWFKKRAGRMGRKAAEAGLGGAPVRGSMR